MKEDCPIKYADTYAFRTIARFAKAVDDAGGLGWLFGYSGSGKSHALQVLRHSARLRTPALVRVDESSKYCNPFKRSVLRSLNLPESQDGSNFVSFVSIQLEKQQRMLLIDDADRLTSDARSVLLALRSISHMPMLLVSRHEPYRWPDDANFMQFELRDYHREGVHIPLFTEDDIERLVGTMDLSLSVEPCAIEAVTNAANVARCGGLRFAIALLKIAHKKAEDSGSLIVTATDVQFAYTVKGAMW